MTKDIFPKRKRNRLQNYSYNWMSSYFITICTKDKKCILGSVTKRYIQNDNEVCLEQKIPVNANVELSAVGRIVEKYIESSKNAYENIDVEHYVIMPNHIHLLLYVYSNDEKTLLTNAAIPRYVSALKHFINRDCGKNIFQRSYHDHIVRGEKDFDKIWDYIDGNPICWEKDCFYEEVESAFDFVGDDDPLR